MPSNIDCAARPIGAFFDFVAPVCPHFSLFVAILSFRRPQTLFFCAKPRFRCLLPHKATRSDGKRTKLGRYIELWRKVNRVGVADNKIKIMKKQIPHNIAIYLADTKTNVKFKTIASWTFSNDSITFYCTASGHYCLPTLLAYANHIVLQSFITVLLIQQCTKADCSRPSFTQAIHLMDNNSSLNDCTADNVHGVQSHTPCVSVLDRLFRIRYLASFSNPMEIRFVEASRGGLADAPVRSKNARFPARFSRICKYHASLYTELPPSSYRSPVWDRSVAKQREFALSRVKNLKNI